MTIKELAKELNMSITTVSRVLNHQEKKYRISEKTAIKVREAAQRHQFTLNQVARNLRLQKTRTIGLIIPDISNSFFANLARSIEQELGRRNHMILLCDSKNETPYEKQLLQLLLGRQVDGLLIAPVGKTWKHLVKRVSVPLVLIDRYFEGTDIPYVSTDNFFGAYQATQFLIEKGHKHIACIQGLVDNTPGRNRVKGYKQAMQDHGISEPFISVLGNDYSMENGYKSTQKLLSQEHVPSAIFALNNQIAMGAFKALKKAKLNIPDQISLISFDEQPFFELLSPPLSSIKQPMEEMGRVAVELLFDLLQGKEVQSKMLKPLFIERNSVNPYNQNP